MQNTPTAPRSAADFRAEIARRRIVTYRLAAAVGLNPSTLSAILNERRPLPPALAGRIQTALDEDAR
jgi:plasmid maintenance system antidote protein VapI